MLAAFDGVAELPNFAGERIAVDLGEIAGAFKDVRRFEGEEPGVRTTLNDIEHEGVRVEVRIEGPAFAVPEDGAGNLPARDIAFVDPSAVLMGGKRLQLAERLGHGGLVRGDQPGVAAEEGLEGNGLGRIEGRIIAGAAGGGHALGELLTGQGVVIARDPFKGIIRNRGTLDQPDGRTELAEATAVDLHPLRVVIRLPEILPQRVTEDLTRANGQHTSPPIHPSGLAQANDRKAKPRIITSTGHPDAKAGPSFKLTDRTIPSQRSGNSSIQRRSQRLHASKRFTERPMITKTQEKAEVRTPTSKRIRLEVARAPPFAPPAGGK